jgi:hypothetical protein
LFKIIWDKKKVEQNIRTGKGESYDFLDFWVPIQVYVDNIEISGIKDTPEGGISNISIFFMSIMFVFQSIDPDKLRDENFCFWSNVNNKVNGSSFTYFANLNKETDSLTLKYINRVTRGSTIEIPLKDYTEGVLSATAELLEDIIKIAPARKDDDNFLCLKNGYETIREWFNERYGNINTIARNYR